MKRSQHNGVSIVKGSVRLCIATTGRVTEAKMLLSTGYFAYDQELLTAIRAWRYQPYTLNSKSEVCTSVTFKYRIE
jgi:TonB family protein